jgi:hypothetical protein
MLDYYQLKYPVSSGIEVREQVDGYLDGFRAALGVALLNQAWLAEAFAPNAIYDEGAEKDARDTVIAAYNMTGAPYPQPPEDAAGFIHRIGTDWALVDAGRPLLSGEKARSMTQNRSVVWSRYSALAIGQGAPGTAGDASLSEYMDSNAIKRSWRDPNSVRIDHRDSFFECERSVGTMNSTSLAIGHIRPRTRPTTGSMHAASAPQSRGASPKPRRPAWRAISAPMKRSIPSTCQA